MIDIIARIIFFLLSPFLAYGFGMALWRAVSSAFSQPSGFPKQNVIAFAAGFLAFALVWRIFKRPLELVCTFEHELTHLVIGLLFLKKPRSFVVTRHEGGSVTLTGGKNFVVTLAPYFFPTISYLLLPLAFLAPRDWLPVFLGLLGASVAFHLASGWAELHWRQTDLHEAGITFSIFFLPVANLIFYGAMAALLAGGTSGFFSFWVNGARESLNLLPALFRYL